ncbi:N-acetyltransferase [Hwanghaeella grinnelliae]|uniref:N-acetyltransferase n=1 Tax=Hwanghaeella grinnelliae TaxID=2500179 RepID=A0A437QQH8_9PROT|nr:GNAT family N-acetyltransferase [Hwanghaeella grinnelliae]RVU36773.1 N-acetyltransferase [Hwanghaeella grinnelliae]
MTKIALRPAEETDALDLLSWRNDPATRAQSKNPEKIDEASHLAWFRGKLASPDSLILIAEIDGTKIGSVRFDCAGEQAFVSIALAPDWRGKGLGGTVLIRGIDRFRDYGWRGQVLADVHVDNAASQRIFEQAGFRKQSSKGGFDQMALIQ